MDIIPLPLSYHEIEVFFLILVRVSVILFMLPFFSSRMIPVYCKSGLALLMSIILFPIVENRILTFPGTFWGMIQLIIREFTIGLLLGLLVQIFFEGVRIMGQLVGFQTGFSIANVLDPQSGIQVSILANMASLVAMIFFLLFNGHHILIMALKDSFEIITIGQSRISGQLFASVIPLFGDMFSIAIKIGAPAIAALLFTKVAFGLITKLMPQINIMIVAFPVQIVIGLLFFGICLSVLMNIMERYLGSLNTMLISTMNWIKV